MKHGYLLLLAIVFLSTPVMVLAASMGGYVSIHGNYADEHRIPGSWNKPTYQFTDTSVHDTKGLLWMTYVPPGTTHMSLRICCRQGYQAGAVARVSRPPLCRYSGITPHHPWDGVQPLPEQEWTAWNTDGEIRLVNGPVSVSDKGTWVFVRIINVDPVEAVRYLQSSVIVNVDNYLAWYNSSPFPAGQPPLYCSDETTAECEVWGGKLVPASPYVCETIGSLPPPPPPTVAPMVLRKPLILAGPEQTSD